MIKGFCLLGISSCKGVLKIYVDGAWLWHVNNIPEFPNYFPTVELKPAPVGFLYLAVKGLPSLCLSFLLEKGLQYRSCRSTIEVILIQKSYIS